MSGSFPSPGTILEHQSLGHANVTKGKNGYLIGPTLFYQHILAAHLCGQSGCGPQVVNQAPCTKVNRRSVASRESALELKNHLVLEAEYVRVFIGDFTIIYAW